MTKPAGQRAIAGDKLRDVVTASAWNALMDMLDQWRTSRPGATIPELTPDTQHCSVLVRNDTGATLNRWATVGLSGVTVEPSVNAEEFEESHVLKAVQVADIHATKFAVVQEDIPDGEIGAAVVCGVTLATIDSDSSADAYARPKVGTQRLESVSAGNIRILHIESAGTGQLALVLLLAAGAGSSSQDTNPCCGCPPTQCYDQYQTTTPPLLSVDFGDMLCCDGKAGGVKTLHWNGSAWASPTFWCDPEGGSSTDCGTAVFEWQSDAEPCADSSATYRWVPGSPTVPGICPGGSWTIQVACPEGCSSTEPLPPDIFGVSCDTVFEDVPCTGGTPEGPGWVLVSSSCSCGEAPSAPSRDGVYVGEQVTVSCPGEVTGDDPPVDVPCTDGDLDGVVWSGDTLSEAGDLLYLPGTVLWVWGPMQLTHGWGYGIQFNGCDPLESAHASVPDWTWSPGDLCPGEGTPPTGVPKYVITACAGEPCPPDGYVAARWVLVPPSGYDPAKLELRVGGVVKIRYVMPANRTWCQACLNKMEIEQTSCTWPCPNIPEFVCVRPYGGSGGTCLPYGQSYTMSIPTMTVSNPSIAAIDAGQMSEAAGDYALDLIDNNGWDPRYEDNGCRTSDPTCCTWLAPRSGLASTDMFCEHSGWLGWVLQTCDPQLRHGLNAKRLENYDCDGEATPVLRFGIYTYEEFEPGLIGPALIRWTAFRGPLYGSVLAGGGEGDPDTAPLCCGPGVCGVRTACTPDGGGGDYYDPEQAYAYGYWLTWTLKEILTDGTLVMRMSDSDYSGWVTAFPQEIELSPA